MILITLIITIYFQVQFVFLVAHNYFLC
jgi:hypothetical protein